MVPSKISIQKLELNSSYDDKTYGLGKASYEKSTQSKRNNIVELDNLIKVGV